MSVQYARVILLAGPSGSGKSYVARRTGLLVLGLDDFYKNGTDPTLPRAAIGPGNMVDWDSPGSWNADAAVAAIADLAASGSANVPIYDISRSLRVADQVVTTNKQPLFIAEGIFAAEIAQRCADEGLLADAITLGRPRSLTFFRRLIRDLAEHRKPPRVLIRRGIQLWRDESAILRRQRELGCRPLRARAIWRRVAELLKAASHKPA